MTSITTHLQSLIQDPEDGPSVSDHFRRDVDQWLSYGYPVTTGIAFSLKARAFRLNKSALNHLADESEQDDGLDTTDASILDVYLLNATQETDDNELISILRRSASSNSAAHHLYIE